MSYALLPGLRSGSTRSQTFAPVAGTVLLILLGIGYFAYRPTSGAVPPPTSPLPVTIAPAARVENNSEADDLTRHLSNVRADVRKAAEQIIRARRLAEAAGRSLDDANWVVEARRVHAAAAASTQAFDALTRSLEELDVSLIAINKEN